MHPTRTALGVLSVVIAIGAVGFVVTSTFSSGPTGQERQATDGAVIDALLPLNDDGIAVARIASTGATHAKVRAAALEVTHDLKLQNTLLRSIHSRVFGQPAYSHAGGSTNHGAISFTDGRARMDPTMLARARPFDREFLDMMITLQQRAGALARAQVAGGGNAELKRLSADLARRADVRSALLGVWRERWYGSSSPSSGRGGTMAGMSMP